MILNKIKLLLALLLISSSLWAQENYKQITTKNKDYIGRESYAVKVFPKIFKSNRPKNVILMIGDGMGLSHIFAGMTANNGHLFLENFKSTGFSKTQSADNYITDSAAGGTAISCGVKTYNGAIGVNIDTIPVVNVRELAELFGKSTGIVATSSITHATPASFVAHQPKRTMYESIAADFLDTNIDVFIGGGYKHFSERKDQRDLIKELQNKGYKIHTCIDSIQNVNDGKLAGFTTYEHNNRIDKRKDMLQVATQSALNILDNDKDGFFLMIEGSQIDWASHQNNTEYLIEEILDFDKTIGEVLEFAEQNRETLIIVTADHETGGFAIVGGDVKTCKIKGAFTSGDHTGVVVPIFSYGPGAEKFTGFMENTEIFKKIQEVIIP